MTPSIRRRPVAPVRFAALFATALLAATSARAAPLEAYGKLPDIEDLAISPDGQKLAVILTTDTSRKIIIRTLADGAITALDAGPQKVRSVDWAGPNHLLITTSVASAIEGTNARKGEYYGIFDLDVAAKRLRPLLKDVRDGLNIVTSGPIVRQVGDQVRLFLPGINFFDHRSELALFEVDLATGHSKLATSGHDASAWVVGPDGTILAQSQYNTLNGRWSLSVMQGGAWREVRSVVAPVDPPRLRGLGRDGASVLVSQIENGQTVIREVALANPVWGEPIRTGSNIAIIHDPLTGRLVGFMELHGDEFVYDFIDPEQAANWQKISRAYKGQRLDPQSWSADKSRIVVYVQPTDDGPSYAMVDLKTKRSLPIGQIYQSLEQSDYSRVTPIQFAAGDGLPLSGYVTWPNNRPAKGLPLVVLPHSQVEERDDPGFDWQAQALASRGYAVLEVNYRGSAGYGEAFKRAGDGQVGRKMQTDLSDGVRFLANQGVIDPARVCIVGRDFGGYMALAGVSVEQGPYRCAAAIAGWSNLASLASDLSETSRDSSLRAWMRLVGAKEVKDPIWRTISPAYNADKIHAPVLLIHGQDDAVTPLSQSQGMEKAMRAAGKPVDLVILKKEDHWFSRSETRQQMLASLVAFLEKNNPPN